MESDIAYAHAREVSIPSGHVALQGILEVPDAALGFVLFAHGAGSSRLSPRNRQVAGALRRAGFGSLLFDLLTGEEEAEDQASGSLRFDIPLLARRLVDATLWAEAQEGSRGLAVGYFGGSTGAAAALIAAGVLEDRVSAVVSRGGRPDLAGPALERVTAPTLLVVGERDEPVLDLNRLAFARMHCSRELAVIPRATHLFQEAGALEQVAQLAVTWFGIYLPNGPERVNARREVRSAASSAQIRAARI